MVLIRKVYIVAEVVVRSGNDPDSIELVAAVFKTRRSLKTGF